MSMNAFRISADLCHTSSKFILIWAIHSNKSAEGVSLITQVLYFLVFITRYLDLFWLPPHWNWWNFVLKNVYIWTSLYIILIMTKRFIRTREKEKAWKFAAWILGGSAVAAAPVSILHRVLILRDYTTFVEILWTFSIILEAFCVLPQLLLLRQTTVPTVLDSYYLVTLGSYRALYILNWIWRAAHQDPPDGVSVVFGIIQTALYIDFAWVYYSRQRVKLRSGAIVDADDLRKGFLVRGFARNRTSTEEDVEAGEDGETRPNSNRWGVRGVSIRADDTLNDHDRARGGGDPENDETAPLHDPDHFLPDEDDEDDAFAASMPSRD